MARPTAVGRAISHLTMLEVPLVGGLVTGSELFIGVVAGIGDGLVDGVDDGLVVTGVGWSLQPVRAAMTAKAGIRSSDFMENPVSRGSG